MPDGTLLSMPIPTEDNVSYSDIAWNGISYADILKQINPKDEYTTCHLDPDIRDNRIHPIDGWKPAFGQISAAQGLLSNAGVQVGDLFLFFGWFRQVEETIQGYRFASKSNEDFYKGHDLQIIYGYMEIGEIITDQDEIRRFYWHPHASDLRTKYSSNALYLPSEKLSLNPTLKGYGVLDYREDRVLTMKGKNRGTWNEYPFLMPEHVYGIKKNSAKDGGLYYAGIWQELVVNESDDLMEWAKRVIC